MADYKARPAVAPAAQLSALRFIVADVETTGLNPVDDRLISIGAVEVRAGRIVLGSAFEVVFRQSCASANANILIHGIDGTTQMAGADPAAATLQFFEFAQREPLVGFHADFDRIMVDRASREAVGCAPANPWLDLAYLAPALMPDPGPGMARGLDGWMERFGITNLARHNALADALATAQLLQVVLAQAHEQGITTLAQLMKLERDQRWLGRN